MTMSDNIAMRIAGYTSLLIVILEVLVFSCAFVKELEREARDYSYVCHTVKVLDWGYMDPAHTEVLDSGIRTCLPTDQLRKWGNPKGF